VIFEYYFYVFSLPEVITGLFLSCDRSRAAREGRLGAGGSARDSCVSQHPALPRQHEPLPLSRAQMELHRACRGLFKQEKGFAFLFSSSQQAFSIP